jgi:hypothetical protein
MAKTVDDLVESRRQRDDIKRLFGGVLPDSILKHDKSDVADDTSVESRSYGEQGHDEGFAAGSQLERAFETSKRGARFGALSRFPQNVGRILLNVYTDEGDTVFDPFAGHNSRMELCWRARRNYIGCDISRTFMEANRETRERLLTEARDDMFSDQFTASITLHECDSRQPPVAHNVADFTITSPPYWSIEDYGDELGQLGKNTYPEFIRQLAVVALENQKRLKSGAFCVWCVNDFRFDGKFYSYHMDTARCLRDAGLKQHDIAIIDLGVPIRAAFASHLRTTKILPKRHEYALVFKKP